MSLAGKLGMNGVGPQALGQGRDALGLNGADSQDPLKKLIMMIKQLMEQMKAQHEGQCCGDKGSSGAQGPETAGMPQADEGMKLLEALMQQLNQFDPRAVADAARAVGGTDALVSAANATAAAATPGIPSGFA